MRNWSLSKKIWAVMGLLVFAFVGCVGLGLVKMNKIHANLLEITNVFVKRDQVAGDVLDNQRMLSLFSRDIILQKDEAKMAAVRKEYVDMVAQQKKDVEKYLSIASEEGKAFMAQYSEVLDKWLAEIDKSQKLTLNHHDDEAIETMFAARPFLDQMRKRLDDINDLSAKKLAEKSKESDDIASQALFLCIFISLASVFTTMTIAFFVLRALIASMNQVAKTLLDSSIQVSSAANQIASSSQELSQSSTEQAASLEETASSIEEMNSMVAKNSENATSTAATSTKSQDRANEGKVVVEKMIQSMTDISKSNDSIMNQVNHGNQQIGEIVKVIEEIGSKTKVINDIVFQTKLLSFNASVEAARAGEHGKGFAVVAEEVGNLAQMSGNAAKEISNLLEASIQKVNGIVVETRTQVERLISDGKRTVESGTDVARQCGEMLQEIVTNVASVSTMAGEIASASSEQSRGVTEISKAMAQLDQTTQQNASASEECASAAEELSAQAEALKGAVGTLVQTIEGKKDGVTAAPAAAIPVRQEKKSLAKVVPFKGAKEPAKEPLKKVVGGTPSYNHEGFEEV